MFLIVPAIKNTPSSFVFASAGDHSNNKNKQRNNKNNRNNNDSKQNNKIKVCKSFSAGGGWQIKANLLRKG